jgi:hypothetical protein
VSSSLLQGKAIQQHAPIVAAHVSITNIVDLEGLTSALAQGWHEAIEIHNDPADAKTSEGSPAFGVRTNTSLLRAGFPNWAPITATVRRGHAIAHASDRHGCLWRNAAKRQ